MPSQAVQVLQKSQNYNSHDALGMMELAWVYIKAGMARDRAVGAAVLQSLPAAAVGVMSAVGAEPLEGLPLQACKGEALPVVLLLQLQHFLGLGREGKVLKVSSPSTSPGSARGLMSGEREDWLD